jgi:hypothetical protein
MGAERQSANGAPTRTGSGGGPFGEAQPAICGTPKYQPLKCVDALFTSRLRPINKKLTIPRETERAIGRRADAATDTQISIRNVGVWVAYRVKRTECTEGAAMGTCSIEVGRELKEKLLRAPYPRDVIILRETVFDDDSFLLWVSSPLLGSGDYGAQELEVDGDAIKFKPRRG